MSDNNPEEGSLNNSPKISPPILQNRSKIFSGKKIIVIPILIVIFLILGILSAIKQNPFNPDSKQSSGQIYYSLDERKYTEDKGIRIYLKSNITDEQGDMIAKEFVKYQGVSGYSLIPISLQKQYEKYNSLYPENLGALNPRNHVIIDLYIENSGEISTILENLKTNTDIQAISNITLK